MLLPHFFGRRPPILGAAVAAIAIMAAVFLPPEASGQAVDPIVAYDQAVQAYNAGDWDRGLQVVDGVVKAWGSRAKREFGPVFGHFYYMKGLMHVGKEQYEPAIGGFKTCYEGFPNVFEETDPNKTRQMRNRFRIHSLVQWAGVLQVQEKYTDAIKLYEKALREAKIEESDVNTAHIAINLGQCYLKAEQLAKGKEYLTRALDSDSLSTSLREYVFMILAEDWTPFVKFEEMRQFLNDYGNIALEASQYARFRFNTKFRFLAHEGLVAGEPLRMLLWQTFLLDPRIIVEAHQSRIALLNEEAEASEEPEDAASYLEEIPEIEKEILKERTSHSQDVLRGSTGHYQVENFSAGFAGFKFLADHHPEIEQRPDILHNLVASAVQVNLWRDAYHYGKDFFEEFPNHDLKPAVARLLVEVVFVQGEYEEALRIASDVRRDMELGSEMRDIPDFIVGACLYHLGRHDEADYELAAYLKNYPEAKRLEPGKFYFASNKVKLFDWLAASPALEAFMAEFPTSELFPPALYQAALSRFMLDDYDQSHVQVAQLQARFRDCDEIPASHNLMGDILAAKGEAPPEEVSAAFLEGKRLAEERGNQPETAAYALWQLVEIGHGAENWDQVGKFYDEFLVKYPDSVFRLDVTSVALDGLVHLGRKEEALTTLYDHIMEFADKPEAIELGEMFGSYVHFLKDHETPETMLQTIRNFPGPNPLPSPLAGWLKVAEIEALEEQKGEGAITQDDINKVYFALQAGFEPAQQSTYATVKLARWLAEFRDKPQEAKRLYEFVIANRSSQGGYELALLDTALLEAKMNTRESRESARVKFGAILEQFQNDELRQPATLGIARILMEEDKHSEAKVWWEKYLENRQWSQARAEANYQLANCIEQSGKKPEALKLYVSVYANFPGHLDWSTQAYLRAATILHDSGEDLKSLQVLRDMLQRMGHLDHPGITKGRELFYRWRDSYTPK